MKLTATYRLVNKYNGVEQGYYAGRNLPSKQMTEDLISERIKKSNSFKENYAMIMKDKTVIVTDYKKRIVLSFEYNNLNK